MDYPASGPSNPLKHVSNPSQRYNHKYLFANGLHSFSRQVAIASFACQGLAQKSNKFSKGLLLTSRKGPIILIDGEKVCLGPDQGV